jgi:hypothetical protein
MMSLRRPRSLAPAPALIPAAPVDGVSPPGVSIHRDGLIQKGVWSPRRGQLDFTVPVFAEYLRENYPLASFDEPGNGGDAG